MKALGVLLGLGSLMAFVLLSAGPTRAEDGPEVAYFSFFNGWPVRSYALDQTPRFVQPGTRLRCNRDGLVRHGGTHVRYAGQVLVTEPFVQRLEAFEELVNTLAEEHYGRAPRRLVHRGGFNCRAARGRRGRISEHALGNALDLQGFNFPRLPRDAEVEGLPRHLRRAFEVRVRSHWSPRRARDLHHARFLHRLAETVRQRPDIFRGIVGPPRPRHHDHLHLDAAPWRYAMFSYDPG